MRNTPLIFATIVLPFVTATYDRVCRQDPIPCTQILCVGLGWVGLGWVSAREFNYEGLCPDGSTEIARITPSLDTTASSASTPKDEYEKLEVEHLIKRLPNGDTVVADIDGQGSSATSITACLVFSFSSSLLLFAQANGVPNNTLVKPMRLAVF